MPTRLLLAGLVLLVLAVAPCRAGDESPPLTAGNLPAGWKIVKEVRVPEARLAAFGERLGGEITGLWNQMLSINGGDAQLNTVIAASEEDAKLVFERFEAARRADCARRVGRRVYEVVGLNAVRAAPIWAVLGLLEDEVRWEVTFRMACVESLDYTQANPVFNLFLQRARSPDDETVDSRIRALTAGWTFSSSLRLLRSEAPHRTVAWSFEPAPVKSVTEGRATRYEFEHLPEAVGVPYVDVMGTFTLRPRFAPDGVEAGPDTLRATPFWPTSDAHVLSILEATRAAGAEPEARLLSLLRAVNERITYGGEMGTRDGVAVVLERGLGRCWDRCDALVTLCRAAGLPAREVAGWVPPLGAGHVWTEVHLPGRGWIPVDATTTWLGVSADYLPFFGTEDGAMPVVYLAMPALRRLR